MEATYWAGKAFSLPHKQIGIHHNVHQMFSSQGIAKHQDML